MVRVNGTVRRPSRCCAHSLHSELGEHESADVLDCLPSLRHSPDDCAVKRVNFSSARQHYRRRCCLSASGQKDPSSNTRRCAWQLCYLAPCSGRLVVQPTAFPSAKPSMTPNFTSPLRCVGTARIGCTLAPHWPRSALRTNLTAA